MSVLVSNSLRSGGGEPLRPTLLVLAAGLGSRFGGLKQMEGVGPNGETLLEYAIFDAIEAGFDRVVFVLRSNFKEAFFEQIISRFRHRVQVDYVLQDLQALPAGVSLPEKREKPWGTGQAVLVAKRLIDSPFAVINADDFYGRASYQLAADFLRSVSLQRWPVSFGLISFALGKTLSPHGTVSRGICQLNPKGHLVSIQEHTRIRLSASGPETVLGENRMEPLSSEAPTSMNFFAFTPDVFGFLEAQFSQFLQEKGRQPGVEFFLPEAIGTMIKRGQATVHVLSSPEKWTGVTYPEDRVATAERLAQLHAQGVYPRALWEA